ncbi:glycosyltransferase family 39 protein [Joostella atrarenae]|uniref:Glycosyltransferase family 39 protein n=1 Tax=Joostella atrarenae TaxID=679257 RepID=A0ABS9J423_9FLAO|nr:glycosyltransferase family 39 protein [Joostella atrarenae]MCF8715177.1 glycosyltransferase family 39 protein [Joostella atrarenae]
MRFPFIFKDVTQWDESTFILMGQSWVDGYLPYTELWDLKPPLAFLYFALVIKIFGKSLFAIRFIALFLISLSSLYLYKIGKQLSGYAVGAWVGALYIIVPNLFYADLQGVMTEYIAMAAFIPGIWLILCREKKMYVLAGILFGISIMIRLNLAYPVLFIIIWLYSYNYNSTPFIERFISTVKVIIGVSVPIILIMFVYSVNGFFMLWWDSVILAPLGYNSEGMSDNIKTFKNVLPFLAWGVLLSVYFYKNVSYLKWRYEIGIIGVTIIGIVISFIHSGKFYTHYLIQLYPFLFLLTVLFIKQWKYAKYSGYLLIIGCVISFLFSNNIKAYGELFNRFKNNQDWFYGESIEVSNYIYENFDSPSVYFVTDHLGYWFLDVKPPTKLVTHPDNIKLQQEFLYPFVYKDRKSTIEELSFIFSHVKPDLIITRDGEVPYLKNDSNEQALFKNYLNQEYQLVKIIDKVEVYKRIIL